MQGVFPRFFMEYIYRISGETVLCPVMPPDVISKINKACGPLPIF